MPCFKCFIPLFSRRKFLVLMTCHCCTRVSGVTWALGDIRMVFSHASISWPSQVCPTPPPHRGTAWPGVPGLVSLGESNVKSHTNNHGMIPTRVQKVKDKGWLRLPHPRWSTASRCIWSQTPWAGLKSC